MKIMEAIRSHLTAVNKHQLVLKEGQIIQGKLVNFLPQNNAKILIDGHPFIAQIPSTLLKKGNYFFEVLGTDSSIRLKVLERNNLPYRNPSTHVLMEHLRLPPTKLNIALLELLVKEKIPFQKQQLQSVIQMDKRVGITLEQLPIVRDMILQKIPITDMTFQAINAMKHYDLGNTLEQFQQLLKDQGAGGVLERSIIHRLEELMFTQPSQHAAEITFRDSLKLTNELFMLFRLLQLPTSLWKEEVPNKAYATADDQVNLSAETVKKLAMNMNVDKVIEGLLQIKENTNTIQNIIKEQFPFPAAMVKHDATEAQLLSIKNWINTTLSPYLPEKTVELLMQLTKRHHQKDLFQLLQFLSNGQDVQSSIKPILEVLQTESHHTVSSAKKEQFHMYLKYIVNMLGLNHEHQIQQQFQQNAPMMDDHTQNNYSLKGLLIQLTEQSTGPIRESAQSLIHLIHGLQMQSIIETNHFIQASLQLPGQKFQLNNDIYMQFEGQKTNEGNINPDHCRILFMLHLQSLGETMIVMHIQKRVITLSVFNDSFHEVNAISKGVQEKLKKQLEKEDYQLSALIWKPLYKKQNNNEEDFKEPNLKYKQFRERYDYKI